MEIGTLPLLPTPVAPKPIATMLAQLQPGQVLEAQVEAKLGSTAYLLRLIDSGQPVRARSPLELTPGLRLKLEVITLGDTPQLRILPKPLEGNPQEPAVRQALRQYLPRQIGLHELPGALRMSLAQPQTAGVSPAVQSQPLPEPLRITMQSVLANIPQRSDLATAEGLKRALNLSGLFLESQLAQLINDNASAPPSPDFKSRLLQLLKTLQVLAPKASDYASATPEKAREPAASAVQAVIPDRVVSAAAEKPQPTTPAPVTAHPARNADPDHPRSPSPAEKPAAKMPAMVTRTPSPTDNSKGMLLDTAKRLLGLEEPTPAAADTRSPTMPLQLTPAAATGRPTTEPADDVTAPPTAREEVEVPTDSRQTPAEKQVATTGPSKTLDSLVSAQPHGNSAERLSSAVTETQSPAEFLPADPKSLLHKTEGALARIVLDQLASQPQADGKQTLWQVEIPYTDGAHTDAAKLRIVRERKASGALEQAYWSVTLELHPPGIGSVSSLITLANGRIDSHFWSDHDATADLIAGHLDMLAARLQQAGLEIGQLSTLPGPPTAQSENTALQSGLLSERA